MKCWTEQSVLQDPSAPETIRAATAALVASLGDGGSNGCPRLVSMSHSDRDDDIHQYEVVVELAAGVILPVECGLLECVAEGWKAAEEVGDIVRRTMRGVEASMPAIDHLADQLHVVRMRARRIIDGWQTQHVQSRLVEARLAPYETWRGWVDPGLVLLVEGCDEQLRTSIVEVHVKSSSALEKALDQFQQELSPRLEARARFAQFGATGGIDQLAINAIAHFGDVAETLRRFDKEWRLWLPDWTALLILNGEVTAGNGKPNPTVLFGRGQITLIGFQLPETTLVAATGRPVTNIAQHPFLSSDMTVIEAETSAEDGIPMVTFKLAMPQWLFCSATGRTWRRDGDEEPAAVRDNVVALRVRSS